MLKEFIRNSYSLDADSYDTYYIKPDYTLSNKSNISIANSFSYTYQPLAKRLGADVKETRIELPKQIYFTITLRKNSAKFYISIPTDYTGMIKGKMSTVWPKAELRAECIAPIATLDNTITIGELVQKDYAFKSLDCSTSNLYPLTNLLGIVKSMGEHEEVRITLVVEAYGKLNWIERSNQDLINYKTGKVKTNEKSKEEKLIEAGIKVVDVAADIAINVNTFMLEAMLGIFWSDKKSKKNDTINININDKSLSTHRMEELSSYTRYKLNSEVFKARILIMATGGTKDKNKLNIMSVANSYRDLQGDNELILKIIHPKDTSKLAVDINSRLVKVGKQNIFSDQEVAKFIQLPQRDLQNEFNLDRIDTREVDVPKELQNGKVRIGMSLKIGKEIMATFNDNYNVVPRTLVTIGPQGAGKTTLLKRIGSDNYKAGYSNFVLDYVESCETARDVAKAIPEKDKIVYIIGDKSKPIPLAFPEVSKLIKEDMDPHDRVRLANTIAQQLKVLIDAVTDIGTGPLTAPMVRYLHSAAIIAFIKPGATIKDVFDILRRWDRRNEAIRYAKYSKCFEEDDNVFFDMEELHKRQDNGKIVGTREDLIIGVTNRISILIADPDIKKMLNAPIDYNDDFGRYIEEGKSIFVQIPQYLIQDEKTRDVIATYFMCRLWLTVQMRRNNKEARLCNVIIDEIGQIETLSKFIGKYCTEFRRHRLGLILACHHLEQMKGLLKQLTSSGASYMMLAGIEKKNVLALEDEIKPFTVEEVLNLRTHTALCVVNYGNQYARFVAKQPEF